MPSIWKKNVVYCYLVYALCLVMLHSCTGSREETSVSDSQQPTPIETTIITQIPSPIPTSTLFSTATASLTPTTQLVERTPTPTSPSTNNESQEAEEDGVCVDTTLAFHFNDIRKGTMRWRVDGAGGLHCCEHTGSIYQINRNPDPLSNLALVSVITDGNVPINSSNILVNLRTGAFKILEPRFIGEPRYTFAWLPNGGVVWIDSNGDLYTGSIETQEVINTPAKMTDLWFLMPNQVLVRDEALQFWYFNLENSAWTQLPEKESEKITWEWIDYAAASEDGEYLFFFFHDSIAILLNNSKTVNIIERDELYPIISSGGPDEDYLWYPPKQIKGTPYWFLNTIGLIRDVSGISYPTFNFIIDSRTGEPVGHEVLGIPPEMAIYDAFLSPDRMWVAVEVVEDIQTLKTYPGQVSQTWFISLSTGEVRVEDGEFAGWDAESQDYLNAPLSCTIQEITIDLASPGTRLILR